MKTNIRRAIFETNSSSSHSITISDSNGLYDTILPDEDGNIYLNGGQFGWEWEKYNDPLIKANYCAVDQFSIPCNIEMLKEVIKDHTGAKDVILNIDIEHYESYVDHQSHGTSGEAFYSYQTLKDFIFGKKSYLYTGNDNDEDAPNFYDLDDTVYKSYLKIEGIDLIVKLQEDIPDWNEVINEYNIMDVLENNTYESKCKLYEYLPLLAKIINHSDTGLYMYYDSYYKKEYGYDSIKDIANKKLVLYDDGDYGEPKLEKIVSFDFYPFEQ